MQYGPSFSCTGFEYESVARFSATIIDIGGRSSYTHCPGLHLVKIKDDGHDDLCISLDRWIGFCRVFTALMQCNKAVSIKKQQEQARLQCLSVVAD